MTEVGLVIETPIGTSLIDAAADALTLGKMSDSLASGASALLDGAGDA